MRTGTQTPGPFTYTNESYMWISQSAGIVFNFAINTFTFNGTTNVTKVFLTRRELCLLLIRMLKKKEFPYIRTLVQM